MGKAPDPKSPDARCWYPLDESLDGPPHVGVRTKRSESAELRRERPRKDRSVLPLDEWRLGRARSALERTAERPEAYSASLESLDPPADAAPPGRPMKFFFPDSQDQINPD